MMAQAHEASGPKSMASGSLRSLRLLLPHTLEACLTFFSVDAENFHWVSELPPLLQLFC